MVLEIHSSALCFESTAVLSLFFRVVAPGGPGRALSGRVAPPLLRVQAEVVLASAEMILLYHMINFVQHWNLLFPQMILEIFWRIFKKLVKAPQELSSVLRISGQMLNVL